MTVMSSVTIAPNAWASPRLFTSAHFRLLAAIAARAAAVLAAASAAGSFWGAGAGAQAAPRSSSGSRDQILVMVPSGSGKSGEPIGALINVRWPAAAALEPNDRERPLRK